MCESVAALNAATGAAVLRPDAAVGTTVAVPRLVPLVENVTVPVGPAPLLWVEINAVRVTGVAVVVEVALAVTLASVAAGVTVTTSAGDVLAV